MAKRLLHLRYLVTAAAAKHPKCITLLHRATMVEEAFTVRRYAAAAVAAAAVPDFFEDTGLSKVFLKKHFPELVQPQMQAKFGPLLDKLKHAGVDNLSLKSLVKLYPRVLRAYAGGTAFEENLKFLAEAGLDEQQIEDAVQRNPVILMLSVTEVLSPKVGFLKEKGLDSAAVVAILSRSPGTMVRDIERELVPTIRYLAQVGIDKAVLSSAVLQHPMLLSYDAETRLKPVIIVLRKRLDLETVRKLAPYAPMVFARDVEMLEELMLALKYNESRQRSWLESMAWGVRYGVEAVRDKVDFLMSLDISYEMATRLLRGGPYIFKVANPTLKLKLDFLLKEMKYDVNEVVRRPKYLTTKCLDKVKIRWEVMSLLQSRGIVNKVRFTDLLCLSRKLFVETFVYKYPDCGRIYFGRRSEIKQARAAARPDAPPKRSPY